jgi:hypothetical protein
MIYLASPYSHPYAMIHGHPLVVHGLPTDWSYWEAFDRGHIERCDSLVVLTLEGWQKSVGVAAEIEIARELGRPVWYLAPNGTELAELLSTLATFGKESDREQTHGPTRRRPHVANVGRHGGESLTSE